MPLSKAAKKLLDRAQRLAFNEGYSMLIVMNNSAKQETEVCSNVTDDPLVVTQLAMGILQTLVQPFARSEADEFETFEGNDGSSLKIYKA